MKQTPLSVIYDLADLSDGGAEVSIAATAEQRTKLAEWAGVGSVETFEAQVELGRRSATRFAYDATLIADITQSCVVTLEPVRSHLRLNISRIMHLTGVSRRPGLASHELSPGSEDAAETIQDARYDLASPLLEEFSLAVDPYPRAPGVVFKAPQDSDTAESPFLALKRLKRDD
jgi:hypothetical protein